MNKSGNVFAMLLTLTVFSCGAGSSEGWDRQKAQSLANDYREMTIELLGLHPQAVRWLLNSAEDEIFLYAALEKDGDLPAIKELESMGLVELTIIEGKEKYMRIIPTDRGYAFKKELEE